MNRSTLLIALLVLFASVSHAEEGVTDSQITIGSVLALKGKASGLGVGMAKGLTAALLGEKIGARKIVLITANDFYEPEKAAEETTKLIQQGIFAMIGNVGTPTAIVTLPILDKNKVPAVGFFTGAGVLRAADNRSIVNYRASYVQETGAVITAAIKAGLEPSHICAFVQNDGFGMAGLAGVKAALIEANADAGILESLDRIMAMTGKNPKRNGIGPVGVYTRNTIKVKPGYLSLKQWEKKSGTPCKLVVTVGAYSNIAHFVRNAAKSGEKWIISAVSFTGADNLKHDLEKYGTTDKVLMSQVVPLLQSDLPIVAEARAKLGDDFGFVSLEGYIVGRMWLRIMNDISGDITRAAFLAQAQKSKFDLGGVQIDLTRNNQASDLVITSYLTADGFAVVTPEVWKSMLQ